MYMGTTECEGKMGIAHKGRPRGTCLGEVAAHGAAVETVSGYPTPRDIRRRPDHWTELLPGKERWWLGGPRG